MQIGTNLLSLNSHRSLKMSGTVRVEASQRLSSGFRINSAADDAAGLGITEKMRAQIRGLDQAWRNAQDGISLIQTAEGAIATINEMIIRMRELVVQAANDTNVHEEANFSQSDRMRIQDEINQLIAEIDSVAKRVEFNTMTLLDGQFDGAAGTVYQPEAPAPPVPPGGPSPTRSLYGARRSALSLLDPGARALLQSSIFVPNNPPNFNEFLHIFIGLGAGGSYGLMVDIVSGILSYDPNFGAFVQNELYEPDGSISYDNMRRFVHVLQEGIRAQLRISEDWYGANYGSSHFVVDFDENWNIIIGFDYRGTFEQPFFDIRNINLFGAQPCPNNFGSGFFHSIFGDHSSAREPELIFTPATRNGGGGTPGEGAPGTGIPGTGTGRGLWFHVGANQNQGVRLYIKAMTALSLGLSNSGGQHLINVLQESGYYISPLLGILDGALAHATSQRSILGAMQNRLEFTAQSLSIASENLSASKSRIRDADMAKEMMRLTMSQVLQQASTTMLAQANQASQAVLQLL